jgi:hypothetical protein
VAIAAIILTRSVAICPDDIGEGRWVATRLTLDRRMKEIGVVDHELPLLSLGQSVKGRRWWRSPGGFFAQHVQACL